MIFKFQGKIFAKKKIFLSCLLSKQGYKLKNWVEGLSDKAYYPCESPKKILQLPQNKRKF